MIWLFSTWKRPDFLPRISFKSRRFGWSKAKSLNRIPSFLTSNPGNAWRPLLLITPALLKTTSKTRHNRTKHFRGSLTIAKNPSWWPITANRSMFPWCAVSVKDMGLKPGIPNRLIRCICRGICGDAERFAHMDWTPLLLVWTSRRKGSAGMTQGETCSWPRNVSNIWSTNLNGVLKKSR